MIFKKDDCVRFTKEALDRFYRNAVDVANIQSKCRLTMTVSSVNEKYDEVFTKELGTVPINPVLLEKVESKT